MTGAQRLLLLVTTVVIGLTRFLAVASTFWDWDEAQFALAVRDYDVVQHQPHPPGFPLYIGLAKLVAEVAPSEFRALQSVTVAAAIALFPLLFWLGREARFPFHIAFLGSVLTVFLPSVWIFGGAAFSDVPGLALSVAACALLLRGCRGAHAYLAGAVVLGLAASIRPQALIIGAAPAVMATVCRARVSWRTVFAGAALGAAVLTISYGGAALASESVAGYRQSASWLRGYLREVDSFLSPGRPPLTSLGDDFSVGAIRGPARTVKAIVVAALIGAILSFIRRSPGAWIMLAVFLPFNIFAWLMLDLYSISRYAVSFAPLYGFLAVEGMAAVLSVFGRRAVTLVTMMIGAVVAILINWTLPALTVLRTTPAPTAAATQWIARNVSRDATVHAQFGMQPFARYALPGWRVVRFDDQLPIEKVRRSDVVLREGAAMADDRHTFVRERDRLFDVVRRRYFEASVIRGGSAAVFGDGWYGEENVGYDQWRWMGRRGVIELPAAGSRARLMLKGSVPAQMVPQKPVVEVRLNGSIVDRITVAEADFSRSWVVPSNADGTNILELSVTAVFNPAREGLSDDPRDLGFQLVTYGWKPE